MAFRQNPVPSYNFGLIIQDMKNLWTMHNPFYQLTHLSIYFLSELK